MEERSDSSESDDYQGKRPANWEAIEEKGKYAPSSMVYPNMQTSSDDEFPKKSSSSSPQRNLQVLSEESEISLQNPLIFPSNITHNDPQILPGVSADHNIACIAYGDSHSLQKNQPYLLPKPDNEVQDVSCELRIFQPNFAFDDCSEDDEYILKDLKKILKSEGKLKSSTSQVDTFSKHQTVDQNPSYQGNQNDHDCNELLKSWEDISISDSSERQHHEFISNPKEDPESSITEDIRKRKEIPRNSLEKAAKRHCIAEISERTFDSSSSGQPVQQGSNIKIGLPSFEMEMDIKVLPLSSGISEANTSSRLEKFLKNTKIKLLGDDPVPTFQELISHDPSDLASWTGDFYEIQENTSSGTNNSSDKSEELTGLEAAVSVVQLDEKMIS